MNKIIEYPKNPRGKSDFIVIRRKKARAYADKLGRWEYYRVEGDDVEILRIIDNLNKNYIISEVFRKTDINNQIK